MTIQLMDLRKWFHLDQGEVAEFHKENARTVRIDINTPVSTLLYIKQKGDKEEQFLAVVYGRDRIEFSVDGPFDLWSDTGELWFYTVDGADFTVSVVDHASFTRIVERRVRNPELEFMMHTMYQNMERRLAATADELKEQYERRERQRSAAAAAPVTNGDTASGQTKQSVKPDEPSKGPSKDDKQPVTDDTKKS